MADKIEGCDLTVEIPANHRALGQVLRTLPGLQDPNEVCRLSVPPERKHAVRRGIRNTSSHNIAEPFSRRVQAF